MTETASVASPGTIPELPPPSPFRVVESPVSPDKDDKPSTKNRRLSSSTSQRRKARPESHPSLSPKQFEELRQDAMQAARDEVRRILVHEGGIDLIPFPTMTAHSRKPSAFGRAIRFIVSLFLVEDR